MGRATRVIIVGKDHPWLGHSGVLTNEVLKLTRQTVVELDNGLRAGVSPPDYQVVVHSSPYSQGSLAKEKGKTND